MRLILLGPPGAGKGSLAVRLKDRWGLAHVASGELLRQTSRAKTPLGIEVQGALARGDLVPDRVVEQLVFERLRQIPRQPGFVLDGFPRTEAQAAALDRVVEQAGTPMDRVLYLETLPEVVRSRLAGRWVCWSCGMNYHATNLLPRRPGVCDRCDGSLEQHPDDAPQALAQRLQVYETQTAPLLTYYRQQGLLRVVDGNLSVEALYQALLALFQRERLLPSDAA